MKKLLSKRIPFLITAAAGLLLFSGIASAHVTVKPATSAPGAWETYTIKIPSEKEVATTKVTLKVPENVDLKQYQPVPEWKVTTEKDASGKIKTITWSATGAGINAGEFQQFNFVAQNPDQDADVAWDAYQYYKDGSIVEWTGDEGADSPHSITKITATESTEPADHGHDDTASTDNGAGADTSAQDQAAVPTQTPATTDSGSSGVQTATLVASIAALLLSIVSLITSFTKRRQ
ncbi:YcnI family protein [Paenibacillus favisporus]|uniref:YcnI family copper-binding membrane protein n=1 Tax=Paenibacillus favisporus TaxID=221028 RepID=UPI0013D03AD5|nr:DUF1775 domain-containing protein [Paenibacillus favisporus]